jgi:hypothetical protein
MRVQYILSIEEDRYFPSGPGIEEVNTKYILSAQEGGYFPPGPGIQEVDSNFG